MVGAYYLYVHTVHFYCLMFITAPTKAHICYRIILQSLLHISVPLYHLQGAYIWGLLKLCNIKIVK